MEDLGKLGLSPYETKIYLALLKHGRMPAREIAEKSTVPPTAVYPNLKKLVLKHLIQEFSGEVTIFGAVEPNIAIPAFLREKRKALEEMEGKLVAQAMNLVQDKEVLKAPEVLNISVGREASSSIYFDALKRTTKTYYILGWTFKTTGAKFAKLQHLVEAKKKGVDVRIIVTGTEIKEWSILQEYVKQGIKLRYHPLNNFSLLLVDGKECKITLKNPEYDQKFNIHIKDASLSEALQSYFLGVWEKAELFKIKYVSRKVK